MRKKLFIFLFVFVLFSLQAFAVQKYNNLSKIMIDPIQNGKLTMNLFFDSSFEGNAFLNKNDKNSYSIYVPDTIADQNHVKLIYKNGKDKKLVKISLEEKPYVKEGKEESYLKISLNLKDDYSIKLIKKTTDEDTTLPDKKFNFFSLIIILLFALIIFVGNKLFVILKKTKTYKSNIYMPDKNKIKQEKISTPNKVEEKPADKPEMLKKEQVQAPVKEFSCFDIPKITHKQKNKSFARNLTKNTIRLVKDDRKKATNPIKISRYDESKELDLPYAEKNEQQNTTKNDNICTILSILNITPHKGFYLSSENNNLILYGFINEDKFLLKTFSDLSNINLQARLYDKEDGKEVYILRLDTYKAMIEVSEAGIRELAIL